MLLGLNELQRKLSKRFANYNVCNDEAMVIKLWRHAQDGEDPSAFPDKHEILMEFAT